MYLVRFIRKDRHPDEEYFYNTQENAEIHFSLFCDDDSDLYSHIDLIQLKHNEEIRINRINF